MVRAVIPLFPKIDASLVPQTSPFDAAADRPALRIDDQAPDQALDYAALGAACALFRCALVELGIGPHDRIAIWAHPDRDSIVALVASIGAGVITVPLNPGSGESELAHILADARPKAIFSSQPERDKGRTPQLPVHSLAATQHSQVTLHVSEARAPSAPVLVLYTSGTTGSPKGAVLSASNIAATLDGLQDAWALCEQDTIVHALPLFHAHGLVFGLLGALRVGACLHFISKFTPKAVAAALHGEHRVLYAVPTMYRRLVDAAENDPEVRAGLSAARLLVSGSAALPAREHARIQAVTGQRVCERYGLSETFVNTAVRHDGERRPGYVGLPLEGVELKLVDDARATISVHDDETIGEVAVRGPNVFLGYLNRPDATREVVDADGWFYTGDLGTIAPDGYLRIVGRKATDLIKTGGFKVGAGEVEAALLEHPAVSEAAVVGPPDADLGERIVAFVVTHQPVLQDAQLAATLIDHVAQRLSKHKRPREIRFASELPRNAMGKVLKKQLLTLV